MNNHNEKPCGKEKENTEEETHIVILPIKLTKEEEEKEANDKHMEDLCAPRAEDEDDIDGWMELLLR